MVVSREAGERVTRRREALDIQVRPGACLVIWLFLGSSLVNPGSVGYIPIVGLDTVCGPLELSEQ